MGTAAVKKRLSPARKAGLADAQKRRIGQLFTRVADAWEPRFHEAAGRCFERDREALLDVLKGFKQAAVQWDEVVIGWQQVYNEAGDEWRKAFVPVMKGAIEDQCQRQSVALGFSFDVRNLYAEAWFDDYVMAFSTDVMETTGTTLNGLLQDAQREGWGIPQVEDHLGLVFAQWMHGDLTPAEFDWFSQRMPAYRREMIARTELIRSSNRGINQLYHQWGVEHKEWLATEDDRTCPWCWEMNGKIIPVGGSFWEQGQSMAVQVGDLMRSMTFSYEAVTTPPLHPNCRCTLLPWKESWAQVGVERPAGLLTPELTTAQFRERLFDIESGYTKRINELNKEIDAVNKHNAELFDTVHRLHREGFGDEFIDPLERELEEGFSRNVKLIDELVAYKDGMKEKLLEHLYTDQPSRFVAVHKSRVTGERKAAWENGTEVFRRLVGIPTIDDKEIHLKAGGKGRSDCWNEVISLTVSARERAVVHELGHALEFLDPEVHRKAIEFLESRTEGEAAKWLGDHFARHEITKKDKFINPYMGKIYQLESGEYYATEIVSMGIEMLYYDPLKLAKVDPEYFDFMIGLLRGR